MQAQLPLRPDLLAAEGQIVGKIIGFVQTDAGGIAVQADAFNLQIGPQAGERTGIHRHLQVYAAAAAVSFGLMIGGAMQLAAETIVPRLHLGFDYGRRLILPFARHATLLITAVVVLPVAVIIPAVPMNLAVAQFMPVSQPCFHCGIAAGLQHQPGFLQTKRGLFDALFFIGSAQPAGKRPISFTRLQQPRSFAFADFFLVHLTETLVLAHDHYIRQLNLRAVRFQFFCRAARGQRRVRRQQDLRRRRRQPLLRPHGQGEQEPGEKKFFHSLPSIN
ncbi:MAG: hypothetical protein BWY83_02033 [bacterium ADurb.Bin478]|nr:MAG: hypothetical protein BWY83_02033 [bacterium ADurb.Bin478]